MEDRFLMPRPRRSQSGTRQNSTVSRRNMVLGGAIAGVSTVLGVTAFDEVAEAMPRGNKKKDAAVLNNALFFEHQAIWAYGFAAGKLSDSNVGKAVKALALKNQADHKAHRDALAAAVKSLGVTPVKAEASYDVSSYIQRGEGNLDSDVNIAKLALALETDAAIAYTMEIATLKNPGLIKVGASIGSDESAHAAAIRAAFVALGVNIPVVPSPFVSPSTRTQWILKV